MTEIPPIVDRRGQVVRFIIYAGMATTLLLAAGGCVRAIRRGAERDALEELIVVLPLWVALTGWMLSPYLGALWICRRAVSSRLAVLIVGVGALVMLALGLNSFLVTPAFVGGRQHPTADGVTIFVIPVLQWIVVGIAAFASQLALRRTARV